MPENEKATSFRLICPGQGTALHGEELMQAAQALAAVTPYTEAEAAGRLPHTPFTIAGGLKASKALSMQRQLAAAGISTEVAPETERPYGKIDAARTTAPCQEHGKYVTKNSGGALLRELSTGLFIALVIALSGLVQIIAAHTILAEDSPLWFLSAGGWITIGLAIFGVFAVLGWKSKRLAGILAAPRSQSPLATIAGYLTAINDRHWHKACSCLAGRESTDDLAVQGKEKIRQYLKALHKTVVFRLPLDPARCTFLNLDENSAVIRLPLQLISRNPQSDGSRIRREIMQVLRLVRLEGHWYIIDGYIFGQRTPERLPLPGCPECGAETITGQTVCQSCHESLPPLLQTNEQWIQPRRKPDLAALLSAIIPGLGQVYNGQIFKAIVIGASSWLILPWLAGVIDAYIIGHRINRRLSLHDLPKGIRFYMAGYIAAFAIFIYLFITSVGSQQELSRFFTDKVSTITGNPPETVVSRFKGDDSSYSILFPFEWDVQTPEIPEFNMRGEHVALRAYSENGLASIVISTKPATPNWQPCPAAMEARRLLEEERMEIENVTCGSEEGRKQYRLDSYTADRSHRQSLTVINIDAELIIIAFVCPIEEQVRMVPVFERVANSISSVEQSGTPIRR